MKERKDPEEILSRGVSEVIDKNRLLLRMKKGEKLRIKLGIDPTSPHIHLGRVVPLLKLRDFQDLGHTIVFIVGDFTGTIGDASDKDAERPMLSPAEIKKNLKTYFSQAGKILDMKKVEKHYNSKWLKKLTFASIGGLADAFSISDFIARENVAKRLATGSRVSLREVLYPLMQGYDSVAVRADVELGGTDQRFNLLAGRTLQGRFKQAPQDILMTEIIPGTDGRKMSSSWGNTIHLLDSPEDMYGKIMRLPDEVMETYFRTLTRIPLEEVRKEMDSLKHEGKNPRDTKMKLARAITSLVHGKIKAEKAERGFVEVFQKKEIPEKIQEVTASARKDFTSIVLEAGLVASRSEFRRLIEGNGISILETGEILKDGAAFPQKTLTLKIGKHRFLKIVVQ